MEIRQLSGLGVCQTNCYIIPTECGNAVLIDAPEGADDIIAELGNLKLKKILLTHGHFDHIFSAAELSEKTGAQVYVHKNDMTKLQDSYHNLAAVFGLEEGFVPVKNAIPFDDGDTISQDNLSFRVLHTPGHTSGSVCFVTENVMFTGDTLFKGSRGRTDLLDASLDKMNDSLKLLRDFKGDYEDYEIRAGHGKESTLGYERENNVYLLGFDYEDMF